MTKRNGSELLYIGIGLSCFLFAAIYLGIKILITGNVQDYWFLFTLFVVAFFIVGLEFLKMRSLVLRNLPIHDEFSRFIETRATAISFIVSIFWWIWIKDSLLLESFLNEKTITASDVGGIGIIGMFVIWGLITLLSKKISYFK